MTLHITSSPVLQGSSNNCKNFFSYQSDMLYCASKRELGRLLTSFVSLADFQQEAGS